MIGVVTGMTATPVVGVVVPLLFSLLTAGGAIFVIAGKSASDSTAGRTERSDRAGLLGKQLIAFAIGFGGGLWLGIAGKYHASLVWFREAPPVAVFQTVSTAYMDLGLLAAAMELDQRMMDAGVPTESRRSVLDAVVASVQSRADEKGRLSDRDVSAISDVLKPGPQVTAENRLSKISYPLPLAKGRRPAGESILDGFLQRDSPS